MFVSTNDSDLTYAAPKPRLPCLSTEVDIFLNLRGYKLGLRYRTGRAVTWMDISASGLTFLNQLLGGSNKMALSAFSAMDNGIWFWAWLLFFQYFSTVRYQPDYALAFALKFVQGYANGEKSLVFFPMEMISVIPSFTIILPCPEILYRNQFRLLLLLLLV
jgi:hypothetical protein